MTLPKVRASRWENFAIESFESSIWWHSNRLVPSENKVAACALGLTNVSPWRPKSKSRSTGM